jgi:hypothetical protein
MPTTRPPNRQPPRPFLGRCQWCRTQGHTVLQCPTFQQVLPQTQQRPSSWMPRPPISWQPQAHPTMTSQAPASDWLLDSGASHHVTSDLSNLSLHAPYTGTDDIMIGDGTGLPITHSGFKTLSTPSHTFTLDNILCAPDMKKNLISISKFCETNNVSIEFLSKLFLVKDLRTGATLLKGPTKDGVYVWPQSCHSNHRSPPLLAFSSIKTTPSAWHQRLGHPSLSIFRYLVSKFNLELSSPSEVSFNCNSCHCNKSHKLPFSVSTLSSSAPLEIIFSDVWTSPIVSVDCYKYYVIFVDHFTKYIWFYPLKRKSHVADVFVRFKSLVENFFHTKIVTFYSDNGGEFQALTPFLQKKWHLTPHFTPAYTRT